MGLPRHGRHPGRLSCAPKVRRSTTNIVLFVSESFLRMSKVSLPAFKFYNPTLSTFTLPTSHPSTHGHGDSLPLLPFGLSPRPAQARDSDRCASLYFTARSFAVGPAPCSSPSHGPSQDARLGCRLSTATGIAHIAPPSTRAKPRNRLGCCDPCFALALRSYRSFIGPGYCPAARVGCSPWPGHDT